MATPLTIVDLASVGSTQDEARGRFDGSPVLVRAGEQTAGRGRSGARWLQAPRSLAASLAWQPGWPVEDLPRLTLVAGLAAADVLGAAVGLKWPNDLMVGADKVGGILTEHGDGVVVCGMGVNLHWPSPPPGMGALHTVDPGPGAAPSLAASWAERLLVRAAAGPGDWGWSEYVARCLTVGEVVAWEPDGRGRARGVDEQGRLVVATDSGVVVLDSGAVRSVRSDRDRPLASSPEVQS